jgi:hypothetical protein
MGNSRKVEPHLNLAIFVASGLSWTTISDYVQLYDGDRKTLMESLERIQRTPAEILETVTDEDEQPLKFSERAVVA